MQNQLKGFQCVYQFFWNIFISFDQNRDDIDHFCYEIFMLFYLYFKI